MRTMPKAALNSPLLSQSILSDQIELEDLSIERGVARYRALAQEAIDRGEGASLKPVERLLLHWYEPLVIAIKREQRSIALGKPDVGRNIYGPSLRLLKARRLAVLTMHEVLGHCMAHPVGVPMSQVSYSIGRALFAEANLDLLRKSKNEKGETRLKELSHHIRTLNPMKVNWWAKKTLEDPVWERRAAAHIGVRLIWLLVNVATLGAHDEPFVLAFHHVKRYINGRPKAVLHLDDKAFRIMEEGHLLRQHMRPRYMPMIVPPYPWSADAQGGYVKVRTPFLSKPTPAQKDALRAADLTEVYACLNAVSATPWRINRRMYEVINQAWSSGGGDLRIPDADDEPIPDQPPTYDTDAQAKKEWKFAAKMAHRRNEHRRTDRAEFTQKLGVAEAMFDREAFHFPHQFDFRGRAYPVPPHLNHQGDDVCRGLLEFAEGVSPRGPGIRWLKIHAANCYGVDKVSFENRVAWTDAHLADIVRAANEPFVDRWWRAADKPWQFLAACFALLDPDDAGSHIPVQLDGTCNGLQHYSALGRDDDGAASVNMKPLAEPSDVYSKVCAVVRAMTEQEASEGSGLAATLLPYLERKVVKQTVMTSVYGVTRVGARQQVRGQLKALGYPEDGLYEASEYLSAMVLRGIGEVCASAKAIMAWLRTCAKVIAREPNNALVRWTTPLGMPVVQPYRKWGTITVNTIMQNLTLRVEDESVPVHASRHCDGIAPNFVHSIDAAHMLLTARAAHANGIAFASVHDSFWTHAGTTNRLGAILRREFVSLHSRPILADLVEKFRGQFPKSSFPDPPESGTYDLSLVNTSPYFFN